MSETGLPAPVLIVVCPNKPLSIPHDLAKRLGDRAKKTIDPAEIEHRQRKAAENRLANSVSHEGATWGKRVEKIRSNLSTIAEKRAAVQRKLSERLQGAHDRRLNALDSRREKASMFVWRAKSAACKATVAEERRQEALEKALRMKQSAAAEKREALTTIIKNSAKGVTERMLEPPRGNRSSKTALASLPKKQSTLKSNSKSSSKQSSRPVGTSQKENSMCTLASYQSVLNSFGR